MALNHKGFTEKEIQDMIDWKLQCKQIDEMMWKQHATEIIRKVINDSIINEPIGKPTKSLEKIEEELKEVEKKSRETNQKGVELKWNQRFHRLIWDIEFATLTLILPTAKLSISPILNPISWEGLQDVRNQQNP